MDGQLAGEEMSAYIEERPDAIEAIKKSIAHWNDICYGYCGAIDSETCGLCALHGDCSLCGLFMAGNGCNKVGTPWKRYFNSFCGGDYLVDMCFCEVGTANKAEAMLEALVMLLPPEHRKEYGG